MFQGRKLITMLVSLLAAVLLWLYVVTSVAPQANKRVSGIPVTIDEGNNTFEERGLIVTAQDISTVSLELTSSRSNLSKLDKNTINVNADASKIRNPGSYPLSCSVEWPDTVRSADVDLVRMSTETINITVARLDQKTLPIDFEWQGSVKEGYFFDAENVAIDPYEVTVVAPDYEIAQLSKAVIRYDITDMNQEEKVSVPVLFLDEAGNELELSEFATVKLKNNDVKNAEVSLTLPILRTRKIQLAVELNPGGGVTEDNAVVTLTPAYINVIGTAEQVEAMEDTLTVGTIDLAGIIDKDDFNFSLTLPVGVKNMGGETEVAASVELVGLTTDTISVSDIRTENAPEGYSIEITTRTVQVTVRGSKVDVTRLKNNRRHGIYILVDLQNYDQKGAFSVTGQVINEKNPQIGVMDTVEIGIVISSGEEDES